MELGTVMEKCLNVTSDRINFGPSENGAVTVTVAAVVQPNRLQYTNGGAPTVTLESDDEAWRGQSRAWLQAAQTRFANDPKNIQLQTDWVRALMRNGRFGEALFAAQNLAEATPENFTSLELLAQAAAINSKPSISSAALEALVVANPWADEWRLQAARAYSALGDEGRACSHLRALWEGGLKTDAATATTLRCRYRWAGERETLLAALEPIDAQGPEVQRFLSEMLNGAVGPPQLKGAAASVFSIVVRCENPKIECPMPAVLNPLGRVFSPLVPMASWSGAEPFSIGIDLGGMYYLLLTGGDASARGVVDVSILDTSKRFAFHRGGTIQTIARAQLE